MKRMNATSPLRHGVGTVGGFTLVELLTVLAVLALVMSIVLPSLMSARGIARRTTCGANLRGIQQASSLYYASNLWAYFPYCESRSDGSLWYWGFEKGQGTASEGARPIDVSRARLAPYIQQGSQVRLCPETRRDMPYLKPKFNLAGYGYAINYTMLSGTSFCGRESGDFGSVFAPAETVVWADSMQINTFQAPASATNPMLEEWYYLSNKPQDLPNFHFRHLKQCNAAFADGSVRPLKPYTLDPRCDGAVGRPEKPYVYSPLDVGYPQRQQSYLLLTGRK
jgi:prepilin-type N-terminal cleavage/methylation domain-containing protein/prepilin-type processing-associated H-X9-DG protein